MSISKAEVKKKMVSSTAISSAQSLASELGHDREASVGEAHSRNLSTTMLAFGRHPDDTEVMVAPSSPALSDMVSSQPVGNREIHGGGHHSRGRGPEGDDRFDGPGGRHGVTQSPLDARDRRAGPRIAEKSPEGRGFGAVTGVSTSSVGVHGAELFRLQSRIREGAPHRAPPVAVLRRPVQVIGVWPSRSMTSAIGVTPRRSAEPSDSRTIAGGAVARLALLFRSKGRHAAAVIVKLATGNGAWRAEKPAM
jgi:hypothetical protein